MAKYSTSASQVIRRNPSSGLGAATLPSDGALLDTIRARLSNSALVHGFGPTAMAKRSIWPWVAGALLIGWYATSDDRSTIEPIAVVRTEPRASAPATARKTDENDDHAALNATAPNRPSNVSVAPKSSSPEPSPSPESETMYVDASRLNVRNGPGTESKQIWTLKRDDSVSVIARSGDWRQVRGERYEGWVHGGYLTPKRGERPAAATEKPKAKKPALSDAHIARTLIERSIALYSGSCPCPYNVMRNGRRCGGNSAWSRPGGRSPLCYPSDITADMIAAYRARQ